MTNKPTAESIRRRWKKGESRTAGLFGTERTPLSGGNSKITRSDTLHKKFYIEHKQRKRVGWWRTMQNEVVPQAKVENKIPVLTIHEVGARDVLVVVRGKYLEAFCREYLTGGEK